eukprot:1542832-Amphidinium_carterae.1
MVACIACMGKLEGSNLATCGNQWFRPGTVDPHTPGTPLPTSYYVNDVGYLPDGTSLALAGNNVTASGHRAHAAVASPLPMHLVSTSAAAIMKTRTRNDISIIVTMSFGCWACLWSWCNVDSFLDDAYR